MRTLLTRKWLTALAVATAFFVLCLLLGRWQWGRHLDRSAYADAVHQHYDAPAVPLDQVLPGTAPLGGDRLWTRVTATGRYAPPQLFVRNRPQHVTYGYEVVVPLTLADGSAILVDRGWVQNGTRADVLPEVAPAPGGEVTVQGWLRRGEESLGRDLPAGQLASIDLDDAARASHTRLRGGYLVLESERTAGGATPPRPTPLLPPETDTGPHFAYALQWWAGSVVGFVIVLVYARREHRDRLIASGALTPTVRAPKKRIWDEDDE